MVHTHFYGRPQPVLMYKLRTSIAVEHKTALASGFGLARLTQSNSAELFETKSTCSSRSE